MSNSSLVTYTRLSPNCTKPRRSKINAIVIHHMAGTLTVQQCGNVFAVPSRQASSNYGVNGKQIGLYVSESNRSWCTGNAGIDHRAVTIEVANSKTGEPWPVSEESLTTLIKLCADICRRNGIDRLVYTGDKSGNLHQHRWYQATGCPGSYLAGKFPEIARRVNSLLTAKRYLGAKIVLKKHKDGKYLIKGDKGQQVKNLQSFLNWYGSYGLDVDGIYGTQTKLAVIKFQGANSLVRDGIFGVKSLAKAKTYYEA